MFITPAELALLLDLVSRVQLPVGATINQLQPILKRAAGLASLKGDVKIGEVVPAGTSGNGVVADMQPKFD